jgi:DEAD/DEAH box helicase domain-containing protein
MYKKVRFLTHENIGAGPISLPEQDLHTIAAWFAFDPQSLRGVDRAEVDAGLSGLAAVLHAAACLLCMCDPRDIGTQAELRAAPPPAAVLGTPEAVNATPADEPVEFIAGWRPAGSREAAATEVGWPTCYIYDTVAGGVGFAERCHSKHSDLLDMAGELVDGCACDGGCPSCVGPAPARLDGRAATRRLLVIAR